MGTNLPLDKDMSALVLGLLDRLAACSSMHVPNHHDQLRATVLSVQSIRFCLDAASGRTISWPTAVQAIRQDAAFMNTQLQRFLRRQQCPGSARNAIVDELRWTESLLEYFDDSVYRLFPKLRAEESDWRHPVRAVAPSLDSLMVTIMELYESCCDLSEAATARNDADSGRPDAVVKAAKTSCGGRLLCDQAERSTPSRKSQSLLCLSDDRWPPAQGRTGSSDEGIASFSHAVLASSPPAFGSVARRKGRTIPRILAGSLSDFDHSIRQLHLVQCPAPGPDDETLRTAVSEPVRVRDFASFVVGSRAQVDGRGDSQENGDHHASRLEREGWPMHTTILPETQRSDRARAYTINEPTRELQARLDQKRGKPGSGLHIRRDGRQREQTL